MLGRRRHGALALALLALAAPRDAQEDADPAAALGALAPGFFRANCVRCHGPEKAKRDLRLDRLLWDPADEAALERWQLVLDRLLAGEMPPEDEPRPEPESLAAMRAALERAFASLAGAPEERVLRRLNRVQYRNTLRDLLRIDVVLEDPTSAFPPDDALDGFDVLAEGLVMSDFLLREVLAASRRALDLATFEGPRPEPATHRMFAPPSRAGNFALNHTDASAAPAYLFLNDERAPGVTLGQVLSSSRDGAPAPGWYDFTFRVEAEGGANVPAALLREIRPEWQVVRPGDALRLELYLSAPHGASAHSARRRVLAEALDLPDGEPVTLTRRWWLETGWRVELAFGNAFAAPLERYLEALGAGDELARMAGLPQAEQLARMAKLTREWVERADAPRIAIHAAEERGPEHPSWPPPSHAAAYGDPEAPLEERLADFAARAFRRPVAPAELAPYVRLARESPEGLRTALEAILSSPRVLYFFEPEGELDDWALAARLSYFLWSTMPDERLRALAAEGRLREPAVLRAETERLLADPRSSELVASFTWGWLGLQNTLDMAPDPVRFPEYHRSRLGPAGATETQAFFRHVLDANRPLRELLECDYAFVNADLARLYGLDGVRGTATFERVDLPDELRRGGLLGQAAVLTASANGVDTSPVVRGVWVLERLLGEKPPPPPLDVPLVEPDSRGELTPRQLFEKHRSIESCNECHKTIDPLGFALESFDAIGRWRDRYETTGLPVDPAGEMPDGTVFEDVRGMRAALLAELPDFSRNLAARLASYAAGRTLRPSDRAALDRLSARAAEPGFGLRDLVHAVVQSDLFRRR